MARMSRSQTSSPISFTTKTRLYKALVVFMLLYSCEACTFHGYRHLKTSTSHQYKRASPEHLRINCWPTRAHPGDRQTTKADMDLTSHQAHLSVQDCAPGHYRGRQMKAGWKK
ncbi:hypothetical protein DPMN_041612 [Dreissena polymorpha]|uniref:Uncharacterized protein n=1 Tax=Dreissena polymorpha TaxID=45954 RepID=A0A9D4CX54_DREPO|nr:hypothetical protein DPMN_041612 [Dreissena polymorpha]